MGVLLEYKSVCAKLEPNENWYVELRTIKFRFKYCHMPISIKIESWRCEGYYHYYQILQTRERLNQIMIDISNHFA